MGKGWRKYEKDYTGITTSFLAINGLLFFRPIIFCCLQQPRTRREIRINVEDSFTRDLAVPGNMSEFRNRY